MKIPMLDLKRQYLPIKEEIDAAVNEVIDSTQFILGRKVGEFECAAAGYLNSKYTIACANGTEALQIALMALDIKPGDEVITSPFTFVATAETIAIVGAVPVYVDIDEKTYNIDPAKLEAAITPKTKAIIPVHLFGQSADMDPIMEIANKHGLYVIEDAAQSFGEEYKGKKVGTIGHIGTTSFFPSKNLSCYGDGGMLFTQDEKLAQKIRMIANHGSKERYKHEYLGLNSRLDTIQAAILLEKIKYIDEWNSARKKNAELYNEKLKDVDVILPFRAESSKHIYNQYSIRVKNRDKLVEKLNERGVAYGIYYPIPLHQQPAFVNISKFTDLAISEQVCKDIISLPVFPEMTTEEIDYVVETLKSI